MSAYLSAANRVANTARGKATNEIKRQSKRQTTSMVNAWVDAWIPKPKAKAQPARKRRLGYFSAATNPSVPTKKPIAGSCSSTTMATRLRCTRQHRQSGDP
jgi:hypothetical protein